MHLCLSTCYNPLSMKISCCIVAAGTGRRLGPEFEDIPKALVPLLGRAMLYYSLSAFDNTGEFTGDGGIDRFVVAVPPGSLEQFENLIKDWGFSRPVILVEGGDTRSCSVRNALNALDDDPPDLVLIHDCARACLTPGMVDLLLKVAANHDISETIGATLAHQSVDTLRIINEDRIAGEVDREVIACIETPQLFTFSRLLELHETCTESEIPTDDTTLYTRAGEVVKVIYHDDRNLKITYPEDIGVAEGVLFQRGWQDDSEGED